MREGWTYKKLGEVVHVMNGFAFKSNLYVDKGIRVMRITNVQKGKIVDDDPKFYPKSAENEIKNYLLKENDLLMSLTGNVGRAGLLQRNMLPAALNQRVACLRTKTDELTLQFLFHLLNSDIFEKEAILSSKGIAQKNMSTEWLKDYFIPLPPKSQQEAIVSELDEINSLLALKREQLQKYDKLAQSLFYEMFGDPVENEKGWEVKKWKEVLSIINGKNQREVEDEAGLYPICGSGGIMGRANRFLCPSNCTIIGRKGNINKPIFMKEPFWNVDTAFGLKPDIIVLDPYYLFYFCKDYDFEHLNKAVTIPSLTKADLLQVPIPLPPLSLQQQFASRIEQIESQKQQVQAAIEKLETLLASRMQYWFE